MKYNYNDIIIEGKSSYILILRCEMKYFPLIFQNIAKNVQRFYST